MKMVKFLKNKSIKKSKLKYWAILITAVEFLLLVIVAFVSMYQIMKKMSESYANALIDRTIQSINIEMKNPIIVGRTFANDPNLIQYLEDEYQYGTKEFIEITSKYLGDLEKTVGDEYKVYLISDKTRRYFTSAGLNKQIDINNDEHDVWYKMFLATSGDYNIDIDQDESRDGAWTAFVNYRIKDDNGKYMGCIAIAYDVSKLQTSFGELERKYGISIDILDDERNIILDSGDLSVKKSLYDLAELKEKYSRNFEMKGFGFVTSTYVDELDWWIRVENSNAMLIETVRQMAIMFLAVFAIIILAMIGINYNIFEKQSDKIENDANKDGMNYLAVIYHSMHMFTLDDGKYEVLKASDYIYSLEKQLDSKKIVDIKTRLAFIMRESVIDEIAFNEISDFLDLDTLIERLEKQDSITREFVGRNGVWFRASFIVTGRRKDGTPREFIYATEDIDEQKNYEAALKKQSQTDMLTGISNRGYGELRISEFLAKKQPGMMLLMDADKFKSINDTYGHDAGDAVIVAIAKNLQLTFRNTDVLMRLGGDEFVAYVVGISYSQDASKLVNKFFDNLSNTKLEQLGDRRIEMSIGAVIYRGEKRIRFDEIYKEADNLLYESKKTKGNMCNYKVI